MSEKIMIVLFFIIIVFFTSAFICVKTKLDAVENRLAIERAEIEEMKAEIAALQKDLEDISQNLIFKDYHYISDAFLIFTRDNTRQAIIRHPENYNNGDIELAADEFFAEMFSSIFTRKRVCCKAPNATKIFRKIIGEFLQER